MRIGEYFSCIDIAPCLKDSVLLSLGITSGNSLIISIVIGDSFLCFLIAFNISGTWFDSQSITVEPSGHSCANPKSFPPNLCR